VGERIASTDEVLSALAEAAQLRHPTVGQVSGWAVSPELAHQLWLHRARKKAEITVTHRNGDHHQRASVPVSRDIVADPIPGAQVGVAQRNTDLAPDTEIEPVVTVTDVTPISPEGEWRKRKKWRRLKVTLKVRLRW
jgi:hypothetical protein